MWNIPVGAAAGGGVVGRAFDVGVRGGGGHGVFWKNYVEQKQQVFEILCRSCSHSQTSILQNRTIGQAV